jgi:hypothetical protein
MKFFKYHLYHRAPECFETEPVPVYHVYEEGKFDTVNLTGHTIATCDNEFDALLVVSALSFLHDNLK